MAMQLKNLARLDAHAKAAIAAQAAAHRALQTSAAAAVSTEPRHGAV